ncbi:MAG TPA: hypothetical protein VEF55_00900 [Candidatus Binatia bacterium]|nr:hypothetical protein [Candidatus Binatia bacterium]
MTPFDPHPAHFDPTAFPPLLRAVSLVLSVAIVGIIVLQTATTAAAVIA